MNFKKSALGLLAAGALSFGMVSGAMAQEDTANLSAELQSVDCSLAVINHPVDTEDVRTAFDLGEWEWNGEDGYTVPTPNDGQSIQFDLVASEDGVTNCGYTVALSGGGLTGEIEEDTIAASHLTWDGASLSQSQNVDVEEAEGTIKLASAPDNVAADTYTGTLNFTIVNE